MRSLKKNDNTINENGQIKMTSFWKNSISHKEHIYIYIKKKAYKHTANSN